MNKQITILTILTVLVVLFGITFLFAFNPKQPIHTQLASTKEVSPEITADGSVSSANTATLHFQTGGKVVGLYAKEGDKVYAGQTIAQLDTYPLQQQLTAALNTYRSARDTFDQAQANQQNGVLKGNQTSGLNPYTQSAVGGGDTEYTAINDAVKRIVDQNQANLDNSVVNVQLANYALQLATLTSPISGIVTHEDITTPNVNIGPTTSFVIADPQTLVFDANIPQYQIDYVHVGSRAVINVDGVQGRKFAGTVTKIYPQKMTLANGQQVYKVEITADGLVGNATFDQTGSAVITSDATRGVFLIPAWAIVNHQYVWVSENNKPTLRKVVVGNLHGSDFEIKSGLKENDSIILNPQSIASKKYILL